jgi:2,3-dihydro-2,3-dihydroxybenzoate dehydrogenase
MSRFRQRVACVVGAAGGIGQACAVALAAEGARVALCDSDGDGLRGTSQMVSDSIALEFDIRDAVAVEASLLRIESVLGHIDHLVIASGLFRASPMLETTPQQWAELFAVNVFGSVVLLGNIAKLMSVRQRGSIVVVASQSAKVVRVRQAAYGASKAALTYAAKALGLELASTGVRVNVVHPGVTDTPLSRRLWKGGQGSAEAHVTGALENFRPPIPLGKVGRSEDVAAAVLFLLSDDAGHITMSELVVDGGATFIA